MDSSPAAVYGDIPIKDRAALAVRYLAEGNDLEECKVNLSVPAHLAREYFDWLRRFTYLALSYGVEHWHLAARMWNALYSRAAGGEAGGDARVLGWECELLALDLALERVCREHGVGPADIRRMADVARPYSPIDSTVITSTPATPDKAAEAMFYSQLSICVR